MIIVTFDLHSLCVTTECAIAKCKFNNKPRHPSSIIHHPSSIIRHPSSVIRHPPSPFIYYVLFLLDLLRASTVT
jgi:hypothetical protein